ncbi:MAG: ACP S-malonyltransferase [Acidimicrobiia bacterium]|nr:ACP S-malonyltransferase [Acidimicrobiia bacterium]
MSHAVLFPGQGSQFVGMGADLFDAMPALLGDVADEALGWSLRRMCLDGPEDALTRTEHAQPALFAVAYALWTALAARIGPPVAAAGHSLGEYTALAAAGSLEFGDGLRLVAARGRAMASAADATASGMAALIGGDDDAAEALAAARRAGGGHLWVANRNAPGQVVVAGGLDDLVWAGEHAREHGIRRVVPLKVAGAFHSPLMAAAAESLRAAVEAIAWRPTAFAVWANATARPHAGDIGEVLLAQLTSPVRFADTLQGMAASGVGAFVHVGPGDVTAGLARRSVEDTEALVVSSLDDIEPAAERLEAVA